MFKKIFLVSVFLLVNVVGFQRCSAAQPYHVLENYMALGNNGKYYPIYFDENYRLHAIVGSDYGVRIIQWNVPMKPT